VCGFRVCVFITAGPSTKLFTSECSENPVCVCLLLQDLVQRCLHGGGGDMGGHVLRETTSRGLCGLVCPSRTSERGGGLFITVLNPVCVFITAGPVIKLCAGGEGDSEGHVL
jgi:hypothetical protein